MVIVYDENNKVVERDEATLIIDAHIKGRAYADTPKATYFIKEVIKDYGLTTIRVERDALELKR